MKRRWDTTKKWCCDRQSLTSCQDLDVLSRFVKISVHDAMEIDYEKIEQVNECMIKDSKKWGMNIAGKY